VSGPIRVLLVDDQALFRSGVAVVVDAQDDMVVVGQAENGAVALERIRATAPDIVLLDLRMPVLDGVQVAVELFGPAWDGPRPKVIVLTTFSLDAAAATAIRAGASGFLLKDATPEFLLAAVRAVHAGTSVLAPEELAQLFRGPGDAAGPALAPPPAFGALTGRERQVFARAARGASNAEIAAAEFLSESTVKTHVSSILAKLQLRDRVHAVVLAYETGLVTPAP
jgi:DNA-binding NarL/FixJ family response regulator